MSQAIPKQKASTYKYCQEWLVAVDVAFYLARLLLTSLLVLVYQQQSAVPACRQPSHPFSRLLECL